MAGQKHAEARTLWCRHPDVTRQWAATILSKTNYMFISVTALADAELEKTILDTAMANGTRAYVPHGGVVGMDALLENRDVWGAHTRIRSRPPPRLLPGSRTAAGGGAQIAWRS